jgi:hypothetical protein
MKTDEADSKRGYLSNKRHVTSQNMVYLEQRETGREQRVYAAINGGKNVENDDRETHGRGGQADWKRNEGIKKTEESKGGRNEVKNARYLDSDNKRDVQLVAASRTSICRRYIRPTD